MRILVEASGSMVSAFLINAIQEAGHEAIASDIDPYCVGRYLADDFILMPEGREPELWSTVGSLLAEAHVDLVIPSLDETLLGWAQGLHAIHGGENTQVLVSPPNVIDVFVDKWKAFEFFISNGIPTPLTSLGQSYPLVKPRWGRGGAGVHIPTDAVDMTGCISQELAVGEEYTVDVLCDNNSCPVYIVPRKRLGVRDGKSTRGIVVEHAEIERVVKKLCAATSFRGAINVQCFCHRDDGVTVIEVNPRIAGGMALGFAATENWIPIMVAMIHGRLDFDPVPVKFGLQMMRYYSEVFTSNS